MRLSGDTLVISYRTCSEDFSDRGVLVERKWDLELSICVENHEASISVLPRVWSGLRTVRCGLVCLGIV